MRQAELDAEAERIRDARHAAAAVAREKLGDDAAAIELYEQLFEDEPGDARAATALRELYAKAGKHKELLALLARLIDLAESPGGPLGAPPRERGDLPREARRRERGDRAPARGPRRGARATRRRRCSCSPAPREDRPRSGAGRAARHADRAREGARRRRGGARLQRAPRRGLRDAAQRRRAGDRDVPAPSSSATPRHKGALLALARLTSSKGEKAEAAQRLETILGDVRGEEAVNTALRLADLHRPSSDEGAVRRVLERGLAADASRAAGHPQAAPRPLREAAGVDRARRSHHRRRRGRDRAAGREGARSTARPPRSTWRSGAIPAAAADLLVKATELVPGDRELLLALCDAYSASGRGQQAAEALQKIVESYGGRRSKDLAAIHHRLAKAYLAEGRAGARRSRELDIAFKIDPGSIAVLRDLGVLSLDLSATGDDAGEGRRTSTARRRPSARCSSRSSTTRRRSPRARSSTTSARSATGRATTRRPSRCWSARSTTTRSSRPRRSSWRSSRSDVISPRDAASQHRRCHPPAGGGQGLGLRPRLPLRRQRLRDHPHLRRRAVRSGRAPRPPRALGRADRDRPADPARRARPRGRRAAPGSDGAGSAGATAGSAPGSASAAAQAAPLESYIRVMLTRGSGPLGLDPALAGAPAPRHPRRAAEAAAGRALPRGDLGHHDRAPSGPATRRRAPRSRTTSRASSPCARRGPRGRTRR